MTFDAARKEIKRNSQFNVIEFYFSFELLCDAHHILNVRTGCYLLLLSMWGEGALKHPAALFRMTSQS